MLAQNLAQSELARRQATTLRTMMREGIERDGYTKPWLSLGRLRRLWTRNRGEARHWQRWTPANDAAGPSARAAARDFAPGCKDRSVDCVPASAFPPFSENCSSVWFFGPGVFNLLHCIYFEDGHATDTLLLLAQIGGYVLMFIAGIETDIDRMREASVTAFIVALSGVIWPFLLGAGVGHMFGLSWTTSCFPRRGADGHERFHFRAHFDGCRANVRPTKATVILGAAVIDDVMGLFVLAFLAASITTKGEAFGVAPMASAWLQQRLRAGGEPSSDHPNDDDQRLRRLIFRRRIWRGEALARSVDSSTSQADRQ